ncbi:MAG: hypothetical protein E7310_03425 [Clostridiales bacterium]|nr:hypothetical protein [Clostridiales bacterium]
MKKIKVIIILFVLVIGAGPVSALVLYINNDYIQTANYAQSEYSILVDVESSKLYLLDNGRLVKNYSCSGGKWNTPSPIGTWKITKKAKWGEGFGGSWLGLNVPWGNFGIHGTLNPQSVGWASSHGCIRMNNDEVAELYKVVPIGTKVTIVDGVYGVFGKGLRNLKSGMYGSDVMQIQKKLKELGYFLATPNGKFGAETERAVQKYCKANGLYSRKTIDIELQEHMGFMLID